MHPSVNTAPAGRCAPGRFTVVAVREMVGAVSPTDVLLLIETPPAAAKKDIGPVMAVTSTEFVPICMLFRPAEAFHVPTPQEYVWLPTSTYVS